MQRADEALVGHDNLEEFDDPLTYDLENGGHPGEDLYLAQALRCGGPVLDLGCGTGLTSIPIARAGLSVVGIDPAPAMLAHAARKSVGLPARWLQGRAQDFALPERFAFALMSGNAWQALLTEADQCAALDNVRRHLLPGGRFMFDTRNPAGWDLGDHAAPRPWFNYRNALGQDVCFAVAQRFDPATRLMHWQVHRSWHDGERARRTARRVVCRFSSASELAVLMQAHGFEVESRWGDWAGGSWQADSSSLILLARVRP
ncbi:MAG: class I SAM-dependent methyltransferase [Burkholderiales bacterium]|jgi:SAM-dependent methyltransferase|nr:class I SAM-dependent methyltransferase [Burkholderiales bacterium]